MLRSCRIGSPMVAASSTRPRPSRSQARSSRGPNRDTCALYGHAARPPEGAPCTAHRPGSWPSGRCPRVPRVGPGVRPDPAARVGAAGRRWWPRPRSAASTSSRASARSSGRRSGRRGPGVAGFDAAGRRPDGLSMAATQHDVVMWLRGRVRRHLRPVEGRSRRGWRRDVAHERSVALPPRPGPDRLHRRDGEPHARGGAHWVRPGARPVRARRSSCCSSGSTTPSRGWRLPRPTRRTLGRTRADSTEWTDKPDDVPVARTDQDTTGTSSAATSPYGTPGRHGTMFVGFGAEQGPLQAMLERWLASTGPRDELTRYATPADRRLLRGARSGRAARAYGSVRGKARHSPCFRARPRPALLDHPL